MTVEEAVARHLAGTVDGGVPPPAPEAAAAEISWAVGTGIGGAGAEGSDLIRTVGLELGGPGRATVWGFGDKCSALAAGTVNGAFAKALEFEDKYWMDAGHGFGPGPCVVPAALAVAESLDRPVSGAELCSAVAVGADLECRLLRSTPSILASPWNGTYLYGGFGAAAVAGYLYRLSAEQFLDGLGLVYAQLAGNWQSQVDPSLGVRLQAGYAVRNGITAARLAAAGVSGTHGFFGGPYGLYRAFLPDGEPDALLEELGTRFWGTEIAFKAYPCGAVAHQAIEAVERLLAENPGLPAVEHVERVAVQGTARMQIMVEPREERYHPTNHVGAEFSLPWVLACTLAYGRLDLDYSSPARLADQSLHALAQRVAVSLDRTAAEGVTVGVRYRDGTEVTSPTVVEAKGQTRRPLSEAERRERFEMCLRHGPRDVAPDAAIALWEALRSLPDAGDCRELFGLLAQAADKDISSRPVA